MRSWTSAQTARISLVPGGGIEPPRQRRQLPDFPAYRDGLNQKDFKSANWSEFALTFLITGADCPICLVRLEESEHPPPLCTISSAVPGARRASTPNVRHPQAAICSGRQSENLRAATKNSAAPTPESRASASKLQHVGVYPCSSQPMSYFCSWRGEAGGCCKVCRNCGRGSSPLSRRQPCPRNSIGFSNIG